MQLELASTRRRTVSVWDVAPALIVPGRVFARVEDVPAYGWPLVVLLVAVTLIGYGTVESGLIDLEVDRRVQERIAALEKERFDVVERSTLSKMIEEVKKEGEFDRLMTRAVAVVAQPVVALATVLVLPALFYGVVALTGKKPEWHTLVTICVFASYADVVGALVRLALMLRFRTLYVDTSLGLLTRLLRTEETAGQTSMLALENLLSAVDPFRIWFWLIMIVGLSVTSQLRGWRVWATCSLFWMLASAGRVVLAVGASGSVASA